MDCSDMRVLAGVLLTACAAGCSFGADHASPGLQALRSDPMASIALPGTVAIRRMESGEGETLGKPNPMQIVRTFVGTDLPGARAAAITAARDAGWQVGEAGEGAKATRRLGAYDALLTVRIVSDEQGSRLVLVLEARPHPSP